MIPKILTDTKQALFKIIPKILTDKHVLFKILAKVLTDKQVLFSEEGNKSVLSEWENMHRPPAIGNIH